MATIAASFPAAFGSPPPRQIAGTLVSSPQPPTILRFNARQPKAVVVSASSSSFSGDYRSQAKNSVLLDLIQEIEPLDVSIIQKDAAPSTVDAMKRTISGMLGLLPSNQFQVLIEALWEPLSKLLVSSMMTGLLLLQLLFHCGFLDDFFHPNCGSNFREQDHALENCNFSVVFQVGCTCFSDCRYTLRNAEYRLCLERNFDIQGENGECQNQENQEASELDMQQMIDDGDIKIQVPRKEAASLDAQKVIESSSEYFGELTPETRRYILDLQSKIASAKKELYEIKRKIAALQMQQFAGEEKNDLLDYLRSLQPEKVAELSEPASPELKETIHSVVHGLLATLSPKMHSKAHPPSDMNADGALSAGNEECPELVEDTSLRFQPMISLSRDYLARLLFWSMLLGHYLRGLEYRIELMELLSLSSNAEDDAYGGEQVA
ncbi:hypothetical protein AKJ16_DCAP24765 [Drosera capensis]